MRRRNDLGPFDGAPWAALDRVPLPAPGVEDGVTVRQGVVYSSVPGWRPLELDLYTPLDDRVAHPVIVWIHGGAFALGSRSLLPDFLSELDFFRALAREGFVVASIDYRLSSEAQWPAQLDDVRTAVRWLRSRAGELRIDPSAIALWGESAGGHLAAIAGILSARRMPFDAAEDLPVIAAVVDWYGPSDFSQMDAQAPHDAIQVHDDPDSPESRLLGAPIQEIPDAVASANPIAQIGGDAPPFLIRHGRADRLVPFGQSEILAAALDGAGVSVRFLPVDGAGHVFEGHSRPELFFQEAVDFLRDILTAERSQEPAKEIA